MDNSPPAPTEAAPLSQEQTAMVVQADARQARFDFAAKLAGFNGWTMAICAVLCLPFIFFSPSSAVVALVLAGFAYFELRGRRMVRALDPEGARLLAINQLALMVGIWVYCAFSVYATLTSPSMAEQLQEHPEVASALDALQDPMLDNMIGNMDEVVHTVTMAVYAGVAVLGTLFQGSMALYYRSRQRLMLEHLRITPPWVLELQRQRKR